MKVVIDIETIQASREEWARLTGRELVTVESCEEEPSTDLFSHEDVQECI